MPGVVDFAYLRAVCEAFPLASEASHEQSILHLSKSPNLLLNGSTQQLAKALEEWIRLRARGHSLNPLGQLRDLAWFDGGAQSVHMADYLVRLANRYVTHRGGQVALRSDPQIAEPLAHFRWLSLLLPTDLLVAAFSTGMPTDPLSDHVDTLTPHVARLLEKDVAETHLHVGAAASFPLVWIGLMTAVSRHPPDAQKLSQAGKPPFGTVDQFLKMLNAAAVTRLLLASFLWRRARIGDPALFESFVDDPNGPLLTLIARSTSWPAGPENFQLACIQALRTTVRGSSPISAARLASVHQHLLGSSTWSPARTTSALLAADPLADWLGSEGGVATTETRFARRGIRYLIGAGREDGSFAYAFWQYQRIRALTFRYLTVEPGTAGLGWFQQHYNRISPLRACIDGALFDSAVRCSSKGIGLAAIEMRTAPPSKWEEVRRLMQEAAVPEIPANERPEVGMVLHFLKKETSTFGRVTLNNADPRQRGHGCRYGAFSFSRMNEAAAIEAALAYQPALLAFFRGIDVASDELSVPTWVFILPFLRVRNAAHRAAARLARIRPAWNIKPIRATYHAGEDFRRLIEGIRRMHELLEFGLLEAGDRIGHGLAAGVEAERWARDHLTTIQPREERLDDLLWELDRYGDGDLPGDAGRIEQVRREALRIAQYVYGPEVNLDCLMRVRHRLHDPSVLRRFGYPFMHQWVGGDAIDRLVHRYLTDPIVYLRGQEPIEISVNDVEVRMLMQAGQWLRSEIACREMTIETNPTSNVLIHDMGGIDSHPAFRFQPLPNRRADGEEPVQLSINTDDPISFATSLGDEYAYLYGALLRDRTGAHDGLRWLAERRDDGFRSRFTLPASKDLTIVNEIVPRGGRIYRRR